MTAIKPTAIKRTDGNEITIAWSDGRTDTLTLKRLRNACPCAGCKGETILFRSYKPDPVPDNTQGKYELKKIEQVGTYAIKIFWGDDHDTGIYSFDYLRKMGEG